MRRIQNEYSVKVKNKDKRNHEFLLDRINEFNDENYPFKIDQMVYKHFAWVNLAHCLEVWEPQEHRGQYSTHAQQRTRLNYFD